MQISSDPCRTRPLSEPTQGQGADEHPPYTWDNSANQNLNSMHSIEPLNEVPLVARSEFSLRTWKVLVGALCFSIPTYGLTFATGLFQTHWQENQLSDETPDRTSWILSIYGFLSCFLAIAAGILFDHVKPKYYLPFGCLAYVSAFLALGWASTYTQFLGCFALAGVFTCWVFILPHQLFAFGVVDHWFKDSHSFAIGFVTLGAPIGDILFSVVLQALFDRFVWKVAMLLLSSVIAGFLVIGVLLVEPKRTENPDSSALLTDISLSASFGWTFLRSRKFYLFTYTVFVFEFILYAQWGSLPAYAVFVGIGNPFYIQMTYNIGAIFARTLPPYLATLWGPFNVCLIMIFFTMTVMLTVWIPAGDNSAGALFTVAFLVGIGTGSYTPLLASCMSELCGDRGYGKWIGGCYTFASFA
ncbi:major facilitator superfamily domain-containing protein [Xylariales sp. AK1849]|nr:major facilitator superfamily domain-containing protein [Xylariales sp. AK1849]